MIFYFIFIRAYPPPKLLYFDNLMFTLITQLLTYCIFDQAVPAAYLEIRPCIQGRTQRGGRGGSCPPPEIFEAKKKLHSDFIFSNSFISLIIRKSCNFKLN